MMKPGMFWQRKLTQHIATILLTVALFGSGPVLFTSAQYAEAATSTAPAPLLNKGHSVNWWFVFKFNAHAFPGCGSGTNTHHSCAFGGKEQHYALSQQFVYASSEDGQLKKGGGCVGDTTNDPVGATFDEAYFGSFHYVVWNDQFYDDPHIKGCTKACGSPWGHSKGMLVWNDVGNGFVLQVTTPSWPAAGNEHHPRQHDGNTLGCVLDDDVKVSQDFFALKLSEEDVIKVLKAIANASVVTDTTNPQIVNNGGPAEIQSLVSKLGKKSHNTSVTHVTLSSGVVLISKPSALHVPPWQLVSEELGGESLRTATWWTRPKIDTTTASTPIGCWNASLGKPGAVEIATSGHWGDQTFSLKGGPGANSNHAKIGVSTSGAQDHVIFGDMNQQGSISGTIKDCGRSQNGRGGLFYVIKNKILADGMKELINAQ